MSDFKDWFNSLPFFTKYWLSSTLVLSLLGRFGILNPHYLILLFDPTFYQCQLWRLLTSVLYYPISPGTGFHFLINCYFLYNYSLRLETGLFSGKPADYCFLLIFNWICCLIVGLVGEIMILMDPMVLSVLYIWCQLHKEVIVSFWFGTRFKAVYLPWVLLGFNLVLSGGGLMELVGIAVGHAYYFLMFEYPQSFNGPMLLKTPEFLRTLFPDERGGVTGFGVPPQNRAPTGAQQRAGLFNRGHNWGRGQPLGQ